MDRFAEGAKTRPYFQF